jgi:hypothetical protein
MMELGPGLRVNHEPFASLHSSRPLEAVFVTLALLTV